MLATVGAFAKKPVTPKISVAIAALIVAAIDVLIDASIVAAI